MSKIARTHAHMVKPALPAKQSRLTREDAEEVLARLPKETVERFKADPKAAEAFFGEIEAEIAKPASAPPTDREALVADRIERRLARIDKAEQEARVRQARAAHLAKVEAVEAHDVTIDLIRDKLRDAEARKASIINSGTADAGKALLEGRPAPDNSDALRKLKRLTELIAAAEAALDMAAPKRDALVAAERAAYVALCEAANDLVAAGAQSDMHAVRKQFATLAPMLASLWAGDLIREKLIGNKWSFDHSRVRPVSGAIVVKNFLAGIAEDLRPPELGNAAIKAAAEALASKMEMN